MSVLYFHLIAVWTASLSFNCAHGISDLGNIFALEGGTARFPWQYALPFSSVEWHYGDATGPIMMEYVSSSNEVNKIQKYNIEYINETDSIGMILMNIEKSDEGLYTVKVFLTGGQTEESSSKLTVVTSAEFQGCKENTSLKINNDEVACGINVSPGPVTISASMTCDLNHVLRVNCSQDYSDGQTTSCGTCTDLPCIIPEFDAPAKSKITLTFWSDKWQGEDILCNISSEAAETTEAPPAGTTTTTTPAAKTTDAPRAGTTTTTTPDEKTPLSTGAKVGIGVAVVCISVIMIIIIIWVLKKKQTRY